VVFFVFVKAAKKAGKKVRGVVKWGGGEWLMNQNEDKESENIVGMQQ